MSASLFQSTKNILNINRSTFIVILIYSLFISLLTLTIPVAAQTLVNIVSLGVLIRPVVILSLLLFILLSIRIAIKLAQAIAVENIQQNIFAHTSLNLAQQLHELKFSNFKRYHGPEMVNRLFEVITIQKTTGIIFLTALEIMLQGFFSMIILAFYHPVLLAYDILLIIMMFLVIFIPYRGALKAAIIESDEKHRTAAWLDEIAQNPLSVRLANNDTYALDKADNRVLRYVKARQNYFGYIFKHLFGVGAVYVVGNTLLLGAGGYLVINGQMSLGQLVAAELLVNIILTGFLKLGDYFRDYYDLLAGVLKISNILNLPADDTKPLKPIDHHILNELEHFNTLTVKNFVNPETFKEDAKKLSFDLSENSTLLILDDSRNHVRYLTDQIFNFYPRDYQGQILINQADITLFNTADIRKHFFIVRGFEIFTGTVKDNLYFDREDVNIEDLKSLVKAFNLTDYIHQLPEGYETNISGHAFLFDLVFLQKISIIRALICKPTVLFLENTLDVFPDDELEDITNIIKHYACACIVTTQRERIKHCFEQFIKI